MTFTPVSFSSLPLATNVSLSDQTLVVKAGVAYKANFSSFPTAPAGPPGPQGPAGEAGSTIFVASGAPQSSLGKNSDIYINANNGDLYQKASNTWSLVGNIKGPTGNTGDSGPQGSPGSQILYGVNSPPSLLGEVGDTYIDTDSGDVYHKTTTGWELQLNITGSPGTTFTFGITDPENTLGNIGDVFFNTLTSKLLQKTSSEWEERYDFGDLFTDGGLFYAESGIPNSATGSNNDFYLNISSGVLYKKVGSSWDSIFTFESSSSSGGIDILTGTNDPPDTEGNNDDYYINTSSGTLFRKVSGSWVFLGVSLIPTNRTVGHFSNPISLSYVTISDTIYLEISSSKVAEIDFSSAFVESKIVDLGCSDLEIRVSCEVPSLSTNNVEIIAVSPTDTNSFIYDESVDGSADYISIELPGLAGRTLHFHYSSQSVSSQGSAVLIITSNTSVNDWVFNLVS